MTTRIMSHEPSGLGLALKAALPAVPVIGNLPGVRHKQGDLPTWELLRSDVSTDLAALEQYNEVCGFVRAETLPATYPHIAAHVMHMKLMTDTDFPFTPLGAVHLRNRITQHRPIGREERYDLRLAATAITPHPKGELVHLTTEAHVGKELVWDETMSVLFRGKKRGDELETPALAGIKPPAGPVHWNLATDLGRRYGKISGDQNPIHLYPVTALLASHAISHTECGPRRKPCLPCRTGCQTVSLSRLSSSVRSCCHPRWCSEPTCKVPRSFSAFKANETAFRTWWDEFHRSSNRTL